MPMNDNYIMVYDFEATHFIPDLSEPVELAAAIIHPQRLELIEGATFHSIIKPPDILNVSEDNISFHAKAHACTRDDIIKMWEEAPTQETVWRQFATWIEKWHKPCKRKSMFSAPLRGGQNIIGYDNIIWTKLCSRYGFVDKDGRQNIAHPRDNIDLLNILFLWFNFNPDGPESYSMDNLRSFFKIPKEASHTALNDVKVTAELIIRFMKLHKYYHNLKPANFAGSLANHNFNL